MANMKKSVEAVETASAHAAEPATTTVEPEAATGELTATKVVHAATAATEKALAVVTAGAQRTHAEATANMEKAMKTTEDLVSFGQGNFEAFAKAGQIWATGMQDLGKQVAATAQAQVDQTVATFKALAGVKSFKEAVDLQTSLARSSVEKAVAETGKLTDASLKLAEQTFAPLTARVTLAVEKFGRPV
jgi:phasin family protein